MSIRVTLLLKRLTILLLSLGLLSACAGRQQAELLSTQIQSFNETSKEQVSTYLDKLSNVEVQKKALIEQTQKQLSNLIKETSNPHNQCVVSSVNSLNNLTERYLSEVQTTRLHAKTKYKEYLEKLDTELQKITKKLADYDNKIRILHSKLKEGNTNSGTYEDLARYKHVHANLYMQYSEIYLDNSEKLQTEIDASTEKSLAQLKKVFKEQQTDITTQLKTTCSKIAQTVQDKRKLLLENVSEALVELAKATHETQIQDSKAKLEAMFDANIQAGTSLKNYFVYNSFGEGSGLVNFFKAIPGGLISGVISPDEAATKEIIKELGKATLTDLKEEIPDVKQGVVAIKEGLLTETQTELSNTLNSLMDTVNDKIDETLNGKK